MSPRLQHRLKKLAPLLQDNLSASELQGAFDGVRSAETPSVAMRLQSTLERVGQHWRAAYEELKRANG